MEMTPRERGIFLGGKGESFAEYAREVESRNRVKNMGPLKRASALVLQMDPVACQVCVCVASHDYFAPAAVYSIYREVVRNLQVERTDRIACGDVVRFGTLRRKADSGTQMEDSLLKTSVSILCMQDGSLSRSDKSPAWASAKGNLGMAAAARRTRRLFGPHGRRSSAICAGVGGSERGLQRRRFRSEGGMSQG